MTFSNLLLVDTDVQDYSKFTQNCNTSTFPIGFSQSVDIETIKNEIAVRFTTISRIGIVSNNSQLNNRKTLLGGNPYFESSDSSSGTTIYSSNVQFLIDIITTYNVVNIDYLASNTLSSFEWRMYYQLLKSKTGVVVGASNDNSGDIIYYGLWIPGLTKAQLEATYFTGVISNYQSTLDVTIISTSGTLNADTGVYKFIPSGGDETSPDYINPVIWPVTLSGNIKLTLGDDFTFGLTDTSNYFTINNADDRVTIDGSGYIITINTITTGYPGLVKSFSNNTIVNNIGVVGSGTLTTGAGWIGQGTYRYGFIGNITNCYSDGVIGSLCGGIVGAKAGSGGICNINNCYSTGNISDNLSGYAGGIAGNFAGSGGICNITNCFSTGVIGDFSGGIVTPIGLESGACNITNCFSTGAISGSNVGGAGGICGSSAGSLDISFICNITNCYSTGIIGGIAGNYCGGIVGTLSKSNCKIRNCYVTGSINPNSIGSNYFKPDNFKPDDDANDNQSSNAFIDFNTTKHSTVANVWDNNAKMSLDNTSGCWKSFLDSSGDVMNIGWKLVPFLTNVDVSIDNNTLIYRNNVFRIIHSPLLMLPYNITYGTISLNTGILDDDGKSITFDITNNQDIKTYTGIITLSLISLRDNEYFIDTFFLETSNFINTTRTLKREDIYNYKYISPINLFGNITISIDSDIIVGDFSFNTVSGNVTLEGGKKNITINNVINYSGLIGGIGLISVNNIGLISSGYTSLADNSGWIGKASSTYNINNCYSTGDISGEYSGGIVGSTGTGFNTFNPMCTINSCYSIGAISGKGAGGILGSYHVFDITSCYSTGIINGIDAGGIVGESISRQGCTINSCYSTGAISNNNAGGIVGNSAGDNVGNSAGDNVGSGGFFGTLIINHCYSTGDIGTPTSTYCGGIVGNSSAINCTVNNCYVTGAVNINSTGSDFIKPIKNTLNTVSDAIVDSNTKNSSVINIWSVSEASVLNNSDNPWKILDSRFPWKLKAFLKDVIVLYNNGVLTYTSNFPISNYSNAIRFILINDKNIVFDSTVSPLQKELKFVDASAINNGQITYLALQIVNQATEPLDVFTVGISGITLTPNRYTIRKGGRKKILFSILPQTSINKTVTWTSSRRNIAFVNSSGIVTPNKQTVTWTSSRRNIAVVNSSGIVTAKKIFGKTIITATTNNGGKKAKSIITVGIPVANIKVTPKILIMKKGSSKKLSTIVSVSPANASDKGLFLKSNNTSVATVKSGKVIARGKGSTKISVKSADGSLKTAIITVKVK
jgi:uncharacterized protein YjdB